VRVVRALSLRLLRYTKTIVGITPRAACLGAHETNAILPVCVFLRKANNLDRYRYSVAIFVIHRPILGVLVDINRSCYHWQRRMWNHNIEDLKSRIVRIDTSHLVRKAETHRTLIGLSFEQPQYCDEYDEDSHHG
jgi:hypothetical protein